MPFRSMTVRATIVACLCTASAIAHAYADTAKPVSIQAGELSTAIETLARQFGIYVVYPSEQLKGLKTPGLTGTLETEEAFARLLEGTPLTFTLDATGAMLIALPPSAPRKTDPADSSSARGPETARLKGGEPSGFWDRFRLAQAETSSSAKDENERTGGANEATDPEKGPVRLEEIQVTVPEILVKGSRTLNMDIARSRDDVQPYVIYGQKEIERSGATSLEGFLSQRLPMNTASSTTSQINSVSGSTSRINLRGLGNNQTLILVDGHRIAEHYQQGSPSQSDVNGIPMSAIERIEVLPTTASGIYGGGATGGVINIILKRNYTGLEMAVGYENTFDAGAATRRVDLSGGASFNDGKTSLSFAGSYQDGNRLTVGERNFVQRSREMFMANNPAAINPPLVPPLGATTNIRSANGSNLTLKQGNTPLNSSFTHVPAGYAGTSSDNGLALLANAGSYNLNLAPTTQYHGAGNSLLQDPSRKSLMLTVRQEFHPRVQGFLEAALSETDTAFNNSSFPATIGILVPSTAANNPFQQNIHVTVPVDTEAFVNRTSNRDERLVGGVIVELPWQWKMDVDYVWSRSEFSFVTAGGLSAAGSAAIANGTLDVLRDTIAFPLTLDDAHLGAAGYQTPIETVLKDTTLRFAGPIGMLPGGAPILSLSFQHRDQDYSDAMQLASTGSSDLTFIYPGRSQSVRNAYAELRVPVISERNRLPGIRELELQIAGRRDEYTMNGVTSFITDPNMPILRTSSKASSTNPTLGLRWKPTEDVVLRASYGTGFLPPTVNQVLPVDGTLAQTILDPRRGGTPTLMPASTWIAGGNPGLIPEKSTSRSLGFVLTPRIVPNLRLSVDYTSIEKTDVILTMSLQNAVDREAFLPGRVVRGPNLPGDPAGWAGPITFVDRSLANLSRGEVEAYDASLDYRFQTESYGAFDFFTLGTYQPHYKTQVSPDAPMVENASVTYGFPVKWKANAGLTWARNAWSVGWMMRFIDSYLVESPTATSYASIVRSQGSDTVPSQAYHDLFASYRPEDGFFSGAEFQAGIRNVFDKEPLFDARNVSGFYYSPFGDALRATYRVGIKWAF